jgi:hypothetical protein
VAKSGIIATAIDRPKQVIRTLAVMGSSGPMAARQSGLGERENRMASQRERRPIQWPQNGPQIVRDSQCIISTLACRLVAVGAMSHTIP